MALEVELVSPERIAYSGGAEMLICRTLAGEIAFQPGHIPFIGVLATHRVRLKLEDGTEQSIAVHKGFVEVSPPDAAGNTRVTILSDVAELADTIDVERARAAKVRAEEALRSDGEDVVAKAALRRAEVRLEAADRS